MIDHRSWVRRTHVMASPSFFLLIVSSIVAIASGKISMETMQRTLPAYAIAVNAEKTLNASACSRELGVFRDAVDGRKLWAFKVLDSSGEPLPGYVYGNNFWVGSRSQCFDASNRNPWFLKEEFLRNVSRFRKAEDEFPPYKLNFFVALFRHNGTVQYHVRTPNEDLITLGLCFPASCTTDQLSSMLETIFQERTLMIGELYGADFKLVNVRDLQSDGMWFINARMITVAFVLVITVFLMIAGTAYDVLVYQKYLRANRAINETRNNINPDDQKLIVLETSESRIPVKIKPPSIFGEILKFFSMYTNTKFIFNTKLAADEIGMIHGLRFLGMWWMIVGHTIFFAKDTLDNEPWKFRMFNGFMLHITNSASLVVDSFLFTSGFLSAYLYFKYNLKNNTEDNPVNYKAKMSEFFKGIWKRFLRLTPAYMMTIGIVEIASAWHGETSLFYMTERPQETCAKYWWRNLLYINTFFPREEMCLSWSWYLSNDMQYFVFGNFVLILSSVYFYTAVTILGFVFVSSTIISSYVSYSHGYVPTVDEMMLTLDTVYYPPWTRISVYIVGMVTGYIVVRLNKKLNLRRRNIVALWVLGSACNLVVFFGLYNRRLSVISSAIYVPLSRVIWSVGLGWLLIACCTNNGGIVNRVLTLRVWIPGSKLSYCAYLFNPLLLFTIYLNSESSLHMDFWPILTILFGTTMATFLCSYVYALMTETPYGHIVRLLTKPRKQ